MSAADTIVTGGAATGSTTIPLSGTDRLHRHAGRRPDLHRHLPDRRGVAGDSVRAAGGLAAVNPVNSPPYADIQYAGVSVEPTPASATTCMFGVSSRGDWSTPNDVGLQHLRRQQRGRRLRQSVIFNSNGGISSAARPRRRTTYIVGFRNLATGATIGHRPRRSCVEPQPRLTLSTRRTLNNVMFLGATPAQLGMTGGDTTFRYKVVTCPGTNTIARAPPPATAARRRRRSFDRGRAVLLQLGGAGPQLQRRLPRRRPQRRHAPGHLEHRQHGHQRLARRAAAPSPQRGRHARRGGAARHRAARPTSRSPSRSTPRNPTLGQNVTFTITVTNNGPNAATGVVVNDPARRPHLRLRRRRAAPITRPPASGRSAALAAASATLNIIATVDDHRRRPATLAQITAGTPLDPNPANNQAT